MVWAIQNIISLNNPKLPLHPRFKIPNLKNLNNSKIFTSYDSHRQSKLPNRLHLNAKWSSHRECKIYHHYIIWKNQFHKQKVHVLRLKLLKFTFHFINCSIEMMSSLLLSKMMPEYHTALRNSDCSDWNMHSTMQEQLFTPKNWFGRTRIWGNRNKS